MSSQILLVALFTFVIHLVATLSLSVRVVGLQTLRWAVSFSLFNIMALFSRLANTLQAPLLAKTVELNIQAGRFDQIADFRWILAFSTLATIAGILVFPSFQRLMTRLVESYYHHRSFGRLLVRSLSFTTVRTLPTHLKWPDPANWQSIWQNPNVPIRIFVLNTLANAIITVGVLATLYAGYINPDLRATAASMSGLINGMATIIMVLFVDPDIALLADEVTAGQYSTGYFRRYIILVLLARLTGTILAQFILVPAAYLVIWLAQHLYT
ncbi:lipid II flippase family protein [Spirosoma gilvum]